MVVKSSREYNRTLYGVSTFGYVPRPGRSPTQNRFDYGEESMSRREYHKAYYWRTRRHRLLLKKLARRALKASA